MNTLYYGDNLEILRLHVADESVDLVYLDPPFNSNATYNVLFAEHDGTRAAAQIKAFGDTWAWDQGAALSYQEVVECGGKLSQAMQAFRTFLGESNLLAYLAMMAPRLVELRRVLKPTGCIFLHCDPTASHYLKMLMDAVFDPSNFRNEIVWKRQTAHSDARHKFCDVSDTILFYSKSRAFRFRPQYGQHDPVYVEKFYRHDDGDGRGPYQLADMASPNPRPNMMYEWLGFPCPAKGWRYQLETMQGLHDEGRIWYPQKDGTYDHSRRPRLKRYLSEQEGSIVTNVWTDITPLHAVTAEHLGYPTQKPETLLERIVKAGSDKGDVVLDPFCGCGTTIAAAEKLGRSWLGIDITHLAMTLIKHRLQHSCGEAISQAYRVIGEPVSLPDAQTLATNDPYQFQWWALGLVGARPVEQKKGSDKGIDGRLYFHDDPTSGDTKQIIFSVKAGHTNVTHLRDLRGVLDREKAEIGVLITMQSPTKPMRTEAASAGFYERAWGRTKHPRIQILTVEDLLGGANVDYPPWSGNVTFTRARRHEAESANYELELETQ